MMHFTRPRHKTPWDVIVQEWKHVIMHCGEEENRCFLCFSFPWVVSFECHNELLKSFPLLQRNVRTTCVDPSHPHKPSEWAKWRRIKLIPMCTNCHVIGMTGTHQISVRPPQGMGCWSCCSISPTPWLDSSIKQKTGVKLKDSWAQPTRWDRN